MKKLFMFPLLILAHSVVASDVPAYVWAESSDGSGPRFSSRGELVAHYCAEYRATYNQTYPNTNWCTGDSSMSGWSQNVQSCEQTIETRDSNDILSLQGVVVVAIERESSTCGPGRTDEYPVPMGYGVPIYSVAVPPSNPPTSCPTVHNPIEPATGAKFQVEEDISAKGNGRVSFSRTYRSKQLAGGPVWRNNYDQKIVVIEPSMVSLGMEKSNGFTSPAGACSYGWSEIKSKITEEWAQGATASWGGSGQCQVKKNGKVVKNLPVIQDGSIYLVVTPGAVQLHKPDGGLISFQNYISSTNKNYLPMDGDQGTLTRASLETNTPPEYSVLWRYLSKDGELQEYSPKGKLLSVIASNGVKQTLTYDATTGLLSSVRDSLGGKLTFTYSGTKIASVTTKDNKTTSYTYNSAGLVIDVRRPDNTHRKYHYEDSRFPTALTGITDERNVRYATWSYDDKGRAITSSHANGVDSGTVAYNADGSVTVTNALNKQTIYYFDDIAGARRVVKVAGQPTTNCVGANQNYTYTPEGWIESKTDWNGSTIFYWYNTKGQETKRTEAYGTALAKTIITEWHTTLNLKTKVTEADKETTYTYDASGLLLTQNTHSLL